MLNQYGMRKLLFAISAAVVVNFGIMISSAAAFYQLEYQNRCNTNFLDSYIKPGFIFQTFFYNFKSVDMRLRGKEAPGDFKLSVNVSLNQLLYISKLRVLGGYLGGEVIVPFINGHLATDAGRSDDQGVGDTLVAVLLQSDEKKLRLGSYTLPFYWRLMGGAFVPIGDYDHDKDFNVGCNLTTFHTYLSSTIFLSPKWAASWRIMYNIHTKNSEYGPAKDDLKPGQLFNVHFSSCYAVKEGVRVGVLGHYWRQTTDDKLNGRHLRGRELALAVGPGIFLNRVIDKNNVFLEGHALFDTTIRNRPQGTTLQVRGGIMF
ncbi:MAG: transporter [Deltaproteobacteria bacterium]|nr:transporter [Deltaproteobacteria bacterium]